LLLAEVLMLLLWLLLWRPLLGLLLELTKPTGKRRYALVTPVWLLFWFGFWRSWRRSLSPLLAKLLPLYGRGTLGGANFRLLFYRRSRSLFRFAGRLTHCARPRTNVASNINAS
jgi:hypothetical protein